MNYLYHVWYVCYGRYGEQKEGACCCELQRKITTPGDYEDLVKAIKKAHYHRDSSNISVIIRNIQPLHDPSISDKDI